MDRSDKRRILVCILFIAIFAIRLIYIQNPPLDYSSWRQVDTDSIARNFVEYRFNIFFPTLNYDGPMPNYVQLELQITTFIIAILYKVFGMSIILGRLVPIVFFMGSCYYLYSCVKKKSGINVAIMSLLFYGILPINIAYSRNIMPESALLFFSTGAVYYFILYVDRNKPRFYILSVIFTTLAVLTKVPAVIIGVPMIYLVFQKYGTQVFKKWYIYLFPVISLTIPYIYFSWLATVAEQNFVNGIGSTLILPNFLSAITKGETLRYLSEQFSLKIFTIPGIILFSIGLFIKKGRDEYFYFAWLLGAALHVIFIDAVIHLDYYLIIITPIISVFMGYAGAAILFSKRYMYFLYISLIIIILNDYIFLKEIYKPQYEYIEIGEHVSETTSKDALIIIGKDSPELLYTSDRKGWRLYGDMLTPSNIEKLIGEGAAYFIPPPSGMDKDILYYLNSRYKRVEFSDGCYIYDLIH